MVWQLPVRSLGILAALRDVITHRCEALTMDGKIRRLGEDRTFILDLVQYALKVPSFPVERRVQLGEVAAARGNCARRVSWTAVFTRAYGLATRANPVLRQVFVSWPWPRIYQSADCIISVAVNRSLPEGERLYFGRIHSPDLRSLYLIQDDLDSFQTGEPAKIFRLQCQAAKMPRLVRRLGWWWKMDVDYKNKARRSGTGSISALAGHGVNNRLHPCVMTSSFSFGPMEEDGQTLVTLQCDHRVIDGVAAARALNSLCDFLIGQVLEELLLLSAK
jgi:hypothetical protein